MPRSSPTSKLPVYRQSFDWDQYCLDYPMPDVYEQTVYRHPREKVREMQNERFLKVVQAGWANPFYSRRWREKGLSPGDVRSIDDITRLPMFNSDDIKNDQAEHPPFGVLPGYESLAGHLHTTPSRLQSSGGTTGIPRGTLAEPLAWETQALTTARAIWKRRVS